MHETSKAMRRRMAEKSFPWKKIFKGNILDVGAGPDPIRLPGVIAFDVENGDANKIDQYFPEKEFDLVHGSHVLEHLFDPSDAIRRMIKICKRKGHVVITVPDVGAYENFQYPSKYNPDHKASFSMIYKGSSFPLHVHIPTFLEELSDVAETLLARYVEVNYDWKRRDEDQTWIEENGTEIWNEFVLKKK